MFRQLRREESRLIEASFPAVMPRHRNVGHQIDLSGQALNGDPVCHLPGEKPPDGDLPLEFQRSNEDPPPSFVGSEGEESLDRPLLGAARQT